jgi:molybdopterin-guanine dinucleotide biosynthesis protein A
MVNNITGVILAGGAAKRFKGITKAKILVEGRTVISRILDVFSDIFEEIILVTNSPDEFTDFADSCIVIGDVFLNTGPLGGIHSALNKTKKDSVFVVGGDMPFLDKDIILKQIKFFEKNNCESIIPVIGQNIEPLHGIYKKSVLGKLENYLMADNNNAIRGFFKEIDVCYFPVEDSTNSKLAFTNINSPADLKFLNLNPE